MSMVMYVHLGPLPSLISEVIANFGNIFMINLANEKKKYRQTKDIDVTLV